MKILVIEDIQNENIIYKIIKIEMNNHYNIMDDNNPIINYFFMIHKLIYIFIIYLIYIFLYLLF